MSNCKHGAPGTCWVCYGELEEKYIALKKERAEEPMIELNDGGPAFAVGVVHGPGGGDYASGQTGMSLRDWLAGKAMQATIPEYRVGLSEATRDEIAMVSVQMADAMLKALVQKDIKEVAP